MRRVCHRLCGYDRADNRKYLLYLDDTQWEVAKSLVDGEDHDTLDYALSYIEVSAFFSVLEMDEADKNLHYFLEAVYQTKVLQRA